MDAQLVAGMATTQAEPTVPQKAEKKAFESAADLAFLMADESDSLSVRVQVKNSAAQKAFQQVD